MERLAIKSDFGAIALQHSPLASDGSYAAGPVISFGRWFEAIGLYKGPSSVVSGVFYRHGG